MRPLYIFDLDGTLADLTHRLHWISNTPKDWRAFFAACGDDKPIIPNIHTLQLLARVADIWIFSGRSDEVRGKTEDWLSLHIRGGWDRLIMRKAGDFRRDDIVKQEFFNLMLDVDKLRLVAAFDDRNQVVEMWRSNGVTCYQVAPGEF